MTIFQPHFLIQNEIGFFVNECHVRFASVREEAATADFHLITFKNLINTKKARRSKNYQNQNKEDWYKPKGCMRVD